MARKPKSKAVEAEPVEKKKPGPRPTRYTEALGEEICHRISEGATLTGLSKQSGMPARRTMHAWLEAQDSFAEAYAKACEARGDFWAEQMAEIDELLRKNKIDPASARVRSENIRWMAKVANPKRYGEKLDLSVAASPLSDMDRDELIQTTIQLLAKNGLAIEAPGSSEG